jgi:hypothetical protein
MNNDMKRKLTFVILLLIMAGLNSSCSDENLDYEDIIFEKNPTSLEGTWHLMKVSAGVSGIQEYNPGDITITFNESKNTITTKANKGEHADFLNNGTYHYTTSTKKYRYYTYQWVEGEASVINIDIEDDMHKWTIEYIYRINDGGLVFDGGIANDGPGYYFKKQLSNAK